MGDASVYSDGASQSISINFVGVQGRFVFVYLFRSCFASMHPGKELDKAFL